MQIRKVAAALTLCALVIPSAVRAQSPFGGAPANGTQGTVTLPFAVTAAGPTPWLELGGQNSCAVVYTSVGGGSTATVQGAVDQIQSWQPIPSQTPTPLTVTGIGTAGVITNPSAGQSFGGPIAPQALSYIRLNFSSVTSGTVAGTLTCSNAISAAGNPAGTANFATGEASVPSAGTAALLVPARTNRASVTIFADPGSFPIALGGPGVTYSTGLVLQPGKSVTLQTQGAIYGALAGPSLYNSVTFAELY